MNTHQKYNRDHAVSVTASIERGSQDFEDFVYLLSHDVRSSVRALLELPTWIKEDLQESGHKISGSLAEHVSLMDTHTRRLDRMLNDLLAYSRVGRNQVAAKVNLKDTIEAVIEQISPPKEYNIKLELDDSNLWIGDRDALTLFSALLANAIKHHHCDRGTIRVASWREGDDCIIQVEDDGPGIQEKDVERIFRAMTTLKSRDEIEGSGMGLAIVRKIVELYQGRLYLRSPNSASGTIVEMRFEVPLVS